MQICETDKLQIGTRDGMIGKARAHDAWGDLVHIIFAVIGTWDLFVNKCL